MIHALLETESSRPLSFYLAMEEYLAMRDNGEYFFMWQVNPTVIIGRNQQILNEVNIPYCREHGINIVRRKSGGGCVYADPKNIMFSYITTGDRVAEIFARYTELIAAMLNSLGVDARAGGRNDVLIGDRKVSGNAFYHKHGRSIAHGTMLYDTDIEEMLKAITPSTVKLTSKGVESVRSRVTNLTEHFDMDIEDFKKHVIEYLCDDSLILTAEDIAQIEKIQAEYDTPEWLYGNSTGQTSSGEVRIDGAGTFNVSLTVKNGIIETIRLTGDYFPIVDADTALLQKISGTAYDINAVMKALEHIDVSSIIAGLSTDNFIKLLFNNIT